MNEGNLCFDEGLRKYYGSPNAIYSNLCVYSTTKVEQRVNPRHCSGGLEKFK